MGPPGAGLQLAITRSKSTMYNKQITLKISKSRVDKLKNCGSPSHLFLQEYVVCRPYHIMEVPCSLKQSCDHVITAVIVCMFMTKLEGGHNIMMLLETEGEDICLH